MHFEKKLSVSLLSMRVTIFIVMLMWTIDKLIRPEQMIRKIKRIF